MWLTIRAYSDVLFRHTKLHLQPIADEQIALPGGLPDPGTTTSPQNAQPNAYHVDQSHGDVSNVFSAGLQFDDPGRQESFPTPSLHKTEMNESHADFHFRHPSLTGTPGQPSPHYVETNSYMALDNSPVHGRHRESINTALDPALQGLSHEPYPESLGSIGPTMDLSQFNGNETEMVRGLV